MSKTQENLKAAFAGESQANRKYLAFAKKAENENMPGVAKLFRAAAESETVHALNHLRNLGEIKSTRENLETAIAGENYETESMYPEFVEMAEEEKEETAKRGFEQAGKVEKFHAEMYKKALEKVAEGSDTEEQAYFVCQVCGYTASDVAPDTCPVCGAPKEKFREVK